jgi:2-methylcitrate dehydratase
MWKGCATAAAGRNGVFAALLAQEGMTGPDKPFSGKDGIFELVTGPMDIDLGLPNRQPYVIESSNFKLHPAEYNSLGSLDIIFSLGDLIQAEDVESIEVETYWLAYSEIGMEPEKWDPKSRETADHSLPYLIASAIIDRGISQDTFLQSRLSNTGTRELMRRISVRENKAYSARFPNELTSSIQIKLRSGEVIERQVSFPRGHRLNPPSDPEIDEKFNSICRERSDLAACLSARDAVWKLDSLHRVSDLFELLAPLAEG